MTVIINNDMFSSFFSQRGSAGQWSAAANTSHSTSVTLKTLKDMFQKQANDLFCTVLLKLFNVDFAVFWNYVNI